MKKLRSTQGFTLMELTLVVAIIGILAAVMLPKMGSAVFKSNEASTKGKLGSLRTSITIYYADQQEYPTDNLASLIPVYVKEIPEVNTLGQHDISNGVVTETSLSDSGSWSYNNVLNDQLHGNLAIGCTHYDLSGNAWNSF